MSVFTNRVPSIKTAEAKKITRIANRIPKARREMMKPSNATVTVYLAKKD